jgi:hypothetical protein
VVAGFKKRSELIFELATRSLEEIVQLLNSLSISHVVVVIVSDEEAIYVIIVVEIVSLSISIDELRLCKQRVNKLTALVHNVINDLAVSFNEKITVV